MGRVTSELREFAESLALAVVLALVIIFFVAQSFMVQGSSMEPTLHDGERLLVDKLTYRFRDPKRGEIIVFGYPKDPKRKFIKRVIGLPGDRVEIRNRTLFVNGRPVEEAYINGPMFRSTPEVVVPVGTVWVLGDNRNNSEDSRFADVGPVSRQSIVGRAIVRYWPLNKLGAFRVPGALEALAGE